MLMPCPSRSLCNDPSNPFANLSTEREDVLDFIGLAFGPGIPPPIGSNWEQPTCLSACVSTVSQQDADLCAARDELACASKDWCVTNCDGGNPKTGPQFYQLTAQGCLSLVVVNVPFGLTPDQTQVFIDDMVNEVNRQQSICGGTTPSPSSYTLSAQGCVSLITVTVPFSSTMDQVLGFVNAMLAQVAAQQATCAPATGPDNPGQPHPGFPAVLFYNTQTPITGVCPDGNRFTIFVPAGRFTALSQDLATQIAISFAQKTLIQEMFCLSDLPEIACEGSGFSHTITVTGGTASSYSFTVEGGTIPDGLTITPTGGRTLLVSGTPTALGNFSFTIQAVDLAGNFMDKVFDMTVIGIDQISLPDYTTGVAYSQQLTATLTSGTGLWSLTAGTLPAGLTFNAAGLLNGTPTGSTTETFTVSVADPSGAVCSRDFTLKPAGAPLDWSQLVWVQDSGTGVGQFSGAGWDTTGGVGQFAPGQCTGTLIYTGGTQNAQLLTVGAVTAPGGILTVTIMADAATLIVMSAHGTGYTPGTPAGTFTVPAGTAQVIKVIVNWIPLCATQSALSNI